jgi:DNA-binding PadR family transcriptional regulator
MLRARLPGVLLRGTTHAFPKSTYLTLISPDGDALAQVRISDHASPEYGGYRTVGGTSDRWGRADVLIDPAQPDATVIAQVERAVREIRSAIAELTPRDNPVAPDDRVTLAIYAALARQSKQAGKAARLEAGDIREAMVRWVKRKPQIRTLVPILDRMVARGLLTVHEVSRVGTRYVGAGGAANYDPTPRPDYKRDRYYQMTPAGFADARRLAALHGAPKENPAGRLPPITPGNLGGPGYTAKSARARHAILRSSVAAEGYRSTLGKILLLERYGARTMHRDTLRLLARDRLWLRETFGGPGSFAP